jgi:hypothetical protein
MLDYTKNNTTKQYTPKNDLNEITWLKQINTYGTAEDKEWAAKEAQKYYNNLRANGYGYLADEYSNLSHAEAFDKYKTTYDKPNDYVVSDADYEKTKKNYQNALNAAADIAAESSMAYYDSMYDGLNRRYDNTSKAMQLDHMRNSADLNRSLAASGITGGMSESTKLAALSGYQNNLYQNEAERSEELNRLDFEKGQIERDKNAQYIQNELAATEYARRAYESDRTYQMQQDQFDRNMRYNYNNAYYDNMYREATFNEDNRRWDIQNERAAQEHGVYMDDAEAQRKMNEFNYAMQRAAIGDYSYIQTLIPGVDINEVKRYLGLM